MATSIGPGARRPANLCRAQAGGMAVAKTRAYGFTVRGNRSGARSRPSVARTSYHADVPYHSSYPGREWPSLVSLFPIVPTARRLQLKAQSNIAHMQFSPRQKGNIAPNQSGHSGIFLRATTTPSRVGLTNASNWGSSKMRRLCSSIASVQPGTIST